MKNLFKIILAVSISSVSYGQKIKLGLKGGMNISNTKFAVIDHGESCKREYDDRISFYVGGHVEYLTKPGTNKALSIQVELQYSRQGNSFARSSEFGFTFELDQLNLPIILKRSLFNNFSFVGGGYLGYVISSQEKYQGRRYNKDGYYNFDTGLLVGTEYQFNSGLFLELRYVYGLADISNFASPESFIEHEYKNRVFQIGLGYSF